MDAKADAGSAQALLVIRGAKNQGCCCSLLLARCLSYRGLLSPQESDQFESLLASAQQAQARSDFAVGRRILPEGSAISILKFPNSRRISG